MNKPLTKNQMRDIINQGMVQFNASGKTVTKGKDNYKRNKTSKDEVEYVEIEVDQLPEALRKYVVEN